MKKISVVIPTYNPGPLLLEVLDGIAQQSLRPHEVLCIDSTSTDGTIERIQAAGATLHQIAKRDFGHGKTRNYAARIATGDYVVFLTQDAVPRDKHWLETLCADLDDPEVAGVFSRQIARDTAVPMEAYFYSKMYPAASRELRAGELGEGVVFSNASAAMRRDFLLAHPFAEDILMSEDLEWALRVLHDGYKLQYNAASQVTHSHDTTLLKLFRRYFDFGVSHQEIQAKGLPTIGVSKGVRLVLAEQRYLVSSHQIQWIPRSLAYNAAKFFGLTLGARHRRLPKALKVRCTSNYQEYWR